MKGLKMHYFCIQLKKRFSKGATGPFPDLTLILLLSIPKFWIRHWKDVASPLLTSRNLEEHCSVNYSASIEDRLKPTFAHLQKLKKWPWAYLNVRLSDSLCIWFRDRDHIRLVTVIVICRFKYMY